MNRTIQLRLVFGIGLSLALPGLAAAQTDLRSSDGYCYVKQGDAKKKGLVIGAVAGGLIGSQISKNERGLGAVAGAIAGGALGNQIGKNSVKCYNGEYYAYQGKYYDPPPAPSGYVAAFYDTRPDGKLYEHVYYDRDHHEGPPPWGYGNAWSKGWRDNNGKWHDGAPPKSYHQDGHGYWRK